MAQIRKYLQGSTVVKKPVLIDIAGNLYDVQSIRDITYKNVDKYLTNKQLGDGTKTVMLDYYNYLFPAMLRGEVKYSDIKPRTFIVAPEWESDGVFNVSGHGLLKHDVTNDKKAGITLGTDLIYELIDQGVIKPYVAPEKKSLPVKDELEKKIKLKYFNDNDEAFKEGWKNSNTEQRRLMILGAFPELEFDPDLYNGVDTFNAGKSSFMDALQGEINDDLYLKFNSIGGYGLAEMLGMKTSTTSGSKEEEVKPLTRDEAKEKFRKECIESGVLEDYVEDCVKGKMDELDAALSQYKLNLEFRNNFNNLQKAYSAYNEYSKTNKGQWYANYKDTNYNITYNGLTLPDYSKITNEEYHKLLNLLRELIVDGTIDSNLDRTLGILDVAADNGMLLGNGAVKAVVGSENWKDRTVIAVTKSVLEDGHVQYKVRIMSMFDFPEIYENLLYAKFIKQYNELNGLNLGNDFYKEFENLLRDIRAAQTALSVLLQKLGGILKAKAGDALLNWARYDDPHYKPVVKEPESNEEPKDNSKDITTLNRKINRPLELKDYLVAQLVGLGGDIALTIGSLSGGFVNPLTYGGAAASIGGYTYSDLADPNVSVSLALGNLGGNIVLAGLDFIPVIGGTLGAGTRTLKALNTIRKITPWLISAFAMVNATPGAIKALLKVNDPKEKLSFDDWKAIGHGISAVLAAVRAGGINRKARPGNKETGEGGAYGEARSRWDTKYKNKNKKGATEEESANRQEESANHQEERTNAQEEQTAGQLELTGALRELQAGAEEERANGGEEQAASHLEELAGKPRFILITKPEPFKQPIRTETSKQRTRKSRESVMAAFGVSKGNTSKLLTGSDAEARIRAAKKAIRNGEGYIVTDRDKVVRIVSKLKPGYTEISPDATVYIKVGNSVQKSTLGDALLSGYTVKFNKQGGFIPNVLSKYLLGGLIPKFQNSGKVTPESTPESTSTDSTSTAPNEEAPKAGVTRKIKVNGVDVDALPVFNSDGNPMKDKEGRYVYETSDHKRYPVGSDSVAIGNGSFGKSWLEKAWNTVYGVGKEAVNEFNPADGIALSRYLSGVNVNKDALEIRNSIGVALKDPVLQSEIVTGDYNSKIAAQNAAGKINAITSRNSSSSSETNDATMLEGADKAYNMALKGDLANIEGYRTTMRKAIDAMNSNLKSIIDTENDNLFAAVAHDALKKENLANTIVKNRLLLQQYLADVEQRYRNAYAQERLAQLKGVEASAMLKLRHKILKAERDLAMAESSAYETAKKTLGANFNVTEFYNQWYNSDEYRRLLSAVEDAYTQGEIAYYTDIQPALGHLEFRKPSWATPGIVSETYSAKKGGSLTFALKVVLKTIDNTDKNIREASKENNKNMREAQKSTGKKTSRSTEFLLKRAVGIK